MRVSRAGQRSPRLTRLRRVTAAVRGDDHHIFIAVQRPEARMRCGERIEIGLPGFSKAFRFRPRRIKLLKCLGTSGEAARRTNPFGGFGALCAAGYAREQFGFPLSIDGGRGYSLCTLQSAQE